MLCLKIASVNEYVSVDISLLMAGT